MVRTAAEGGKTDPGQLMSKMALFQVPTSILHALAMTAVQIYMSFALTLFYFDLRRRQEGSDLEAAVQEMTRARAGAAPALADDGALRGLPRRRCRRSRRTRS